VRDDLVEHVRKQMSVHGKGRDWTDRLSSARKLVVTRPAGG
jgi:hypothetical protein